MSDLNNFVFGIYPYIALAVFLALVLGQWLCDVFEQERHREEDEQP